MPSRTASAMTWRCASRASPTMPKMRVFSETAALRELHEETGVRGEITGLLGIFPMPQGGGIVITFAAVLVGDGNITPGDDVSDARWCTPETLPANLAFESTRTVLAQWVNHRHAGSRQNERT